VDLGPSSSAVASYFRVSPNLWDRHMRALREVDPNAQSAYLYLLTCRHRNSEGLFYLPKAYVATDVGMTAAEVELAFDALVAARFIDYDPEAEVILDRHALRYFQPRGPKQIAGAVRVFEQVARSPLKVDLMRLAYLYAEGFSEALVEACPELVDKALASSSKSPTDTVFGRDRDTEPAASKVDSPKGIETLSTTSPITHRYGEIRAKHLRGEVEGEIEPPLDKAAPPPCDRARGTLHLQGGP
jgi:hypothetical protein